MADVRGAFEAQAERDLLEPMLQKVAADVAEEARLQSLTAAEKRRLLEAELATLEQKRSERAKAREEARASEYGISWLYQNQGAEGFRSMKLRRRIANEMVHYGLFAPSAVTDLRAPIM